MLRIVNMPKIPDTKNKKMEKRLNGSLSLSCVKKFKNLGLADLAKKWSKPPPLRAITRKSYEESVLFTRSKRRRRNLLHRKLSLFVELSLSLSLSLSLFLWLCIPKERFSVFIFHFLVFWFFNLDSSIFWFQFFILHFWFRLLIFILRLSYFVVLIFCLFFDFWFLLFFDFISDLFFINFVLIPFRFSKSVVSIVFFRSYIFLSFQFLIICSFLFRD